MVRNPFNILVTMFLLALIAPVAFSQTAKTLSVQPRAGVYAGKQFYTNSHALLVGIRQYQHLPKDKWLDYADRDAIDMRDVLIKSYGFLSENVTLLVDEQATKANIEAAMSALSDDERVKPDDRVLVFYSGHGQTVRLNNGGDMGFLIPYDAAVDLAHPENAGPYLHSCLPMDHLWSYLDASPAKHALLLADACYGGLLAKGRSFGERPGSAVVAGLLTKLARQVFTAGGRGEEAFEDPKLGHGAFTFKLLEDLRARAATPDAVFTASELAAEVKTAVGNVTNAKQTPQFGSHDTEGEFLFVSTDPQVVPGVGPVRSTPQPVPSPLLQDPPKQRVNPKDGAAMVYIPAGDFLMGDGDQPVNPRHKATLSGYWMYKNLVTVGMYKKFCADTGRAMPKAPDFNVNWSKEDHPIVNVSWNDATAYCQWAGVSLPTEAQWEKAARGTEGLKFPWGNDYDPYKVWASNRTFGESGGTTAVGQYGVSPYGCTDMAGNAWQWCRDWYDDKFWSSPQAIGTDPENRTMGQKKARVVRGGAWRAFRPRVFRTTNRFWSVPSQADYTDGLRCASGT